MKTLLMFSNGGSWYAEGPSTLVMVEERRSEVTIGLGDYTLIRSFALTPQSPVVLSVLFHGVRDQDSRTVSYTSVTLKCEHGYAVVEPLHPDVVPGTLRRYRRVCVGQDEHTGPWRDHIAEAVKDVMDLVKHWFDTDYPVLEMTLDAQLGVESAILTAGGLETQTKWHGNFYEVKDLAIVRGWMATSRGTWRMTSYDPAALADALARVQEEIATKQVELDSWVIQAVNEQFWDLV